jgi:hypothetical protein
MVGFYVGSSLYFAFYCYCLYFQIRGEGRDVILYLAYLGMPLTILYAITGDFIEAVFGHPIVVQFVCLLILGILQYGAIGFVLGLLVPRRADRSS